MKTVAVSIDFLREIEQLLKDYRFCGQCTYDYHRCLEKEALIEEMIDFSLKTS